MPCYHVLIGTVVRNYDRTTESEVVEELDQVEDEGHHNPDKGQRRPVGMVGNGGEIQEKGSDIRPHIKKGKDRVEGDKLQDSQHFAGFSSAPT